MTILGYLKVRKSKKHLKIHIYLCFRILFLQLNLHEWRWKMKVSSWHQPYCCGIVVKYSYATETTQRCVDLITVERSFISNLEDPVTPNQNPSNLAPGHSWTQQLDISIKQPWKSGRQYKHEFCHSQIFKYFFESSKIGSFRCSRGFHMISKWPKWLKIVFNFVSWRQKSLRKCLPKRLDVDLKTSF